MKHEEFCQLKDLLQLEFQPLSRLLLLLGWSQCRSLTSAERLLGILHREQVRTQRYSPLQIYNSYISKN